MVEIEIKGKRTLCFMVKRGEANDIVIPFDSLAPIDYQRISKLQAEGGELMKVMRDTTLDNGNNALSQYRDLLVVVNKPTPKEDKENVELPKVEAPVTETVASEKPKRGRGRPKKNQ